MYTFLHHRQLWVYLNPIAAKTSCTRPCPYKGMRKANKAKTQSVLSVAIFRDFRRHFYQFSSLRYLYFFIPDGTKEIFTITLAFFSEKSRLHLCSLLKTKVYFVTSHLPMFILVWMFCISLPNTQAFHICDFIPLICCFSCFAQEDGLLETRNTTNWLHERMEHMAC